MLVFELECKICNKKVKSTYGYKEHMLTHIKRAEIYPCTQCREVFAVRVDLFIHLREIHEISEAGIEMINKWKPLCDTISIRILAYINDLHTHYGIFNPLLDTFCFLCLRFPRFMRHKCVNHKLDLTYCPLCSEKTGDTVIEFVKHLLENCSRKKGIFHR